VSAAYEEFVAGKLAFSGSTGITDVPALSPSLFPFQRDLVTWALRRGRAAIFASTGLGKTRMQLEWARVVAEHAGPVLILAPLAVASQTAAEADVLGYSAKVCREQSDRAGRISVTNYDRLHKFDPGQFAGVVLDESSIIKHHTAKTLGLLLDAFRSTPFKLCATATPAPNDWTELGTHAEFLGVCSRVEMLAEFFCHDGGDTSVWRLKGHARGAFWKWVASWGAMVRMPSDLGYEDGAYKLPPLTVTEHVIPSAQAEVFATGFLFAQEAAGLMERRQARRASLGKRVAECVALVNADRQSWVVWCDLNDESDALTAGIDGAIEVRGSMTLDEKESALAKFLHGEARVIVTKPRIAGWGLNWQHCARNAFVGVTDSWESYFQCVRRSWRFGQTRDVQVHLFASEQEGSVMKNLMWKEAEAAKMGEALSRETAAVVTESVRGMTRDTNAYVPSVEMRVPAWIGVDAC
jgi:hypothetical protein